MTHNKRLSVPEGFLAIDGIWIMQIFVDGLVVYPKVIEKHMMAELPHLWQLENIMMDAVKAVETVELGERIRAFHGSRQEC